MWSPRNGRDDIFFVWFDYLKDSLATLGMSMSDAYKPPPRVPEGANEKLENSVRKQRTNIRTRPT